MVQAPHPRLLTLEEFFELPEESPALELIDGVVERKPVGNWEHSVAQTNLVALLMTHPATHGGRALTELGRPFPDPGRSNHRVPDVSYYLERDVALDSRKYPVAAPDFVAEVRSPGQARHHLEDRLQFLLADGARAALLVDPERRSVTLFEAGREPRTCSPGKELVVDALGGFAFDPAALFD